MSEDTTESQAPDAGPAPADDAPERVVYPVTEVRPVPAILGAICEIMAEIGAIGKDKRSDHGNFKFRGIDDVINVLAPILRAHCVFVTPRLVSLERERYESKGGGSLMNTIVEVNFEFTSAADGSVHVVGPIPGEGMDTGDKSTAKAMSVALRTALLQVFAIPTEDRDPDHDVYEVASPAPAAPRREGRARASRPKATDADPWALSNPGLVHHYTGAIDATTTNDGLKVIWSSVVADANEGKLAAVDRSDLSIKIKRRLAALRQDAAAEASQDQ